MKPFMKYKVLAIFLLCMAALSFSQQRMHLELPNISGYKTLKCDFHMHTVFSDGTVWPTVRVQEAWMTGLDVISITDHVEHQRHDADVNPDISRSYDIASPMASEMGLTFIRGAEITRPMPPGHINAIFLTDIKSLKTPEWRDAVENAVEQGAFVFLNHPGWTGQQPDGIGKWYPEHVEILEKGWVQGIEIVNGKEYYPEAHKWCLEKKLTMMGNTDVHNPINFDYDPCRGEHRTMTFVLAEDNTLDAIKEALIDRRTIVYMEDKLFGEEKYLNDLFKKSVSLVTDNLEIVGKARKYLQISNQSDVPFQLTLDGSVEEVDAQEKVTLHAHKTVLLQIRGKNTASGQRVVKLPYHVTNLMISPDEGLPVHFEIQVVFMKQSGR